MVRQPRPVLPELGETVRVTEGPFAGFRGVIMDANEATRRVTVDVFMFGRARLADLAYSQVEKA